MTDYPDIYQPRGGITLYRGDCLQILPTLTGIDAVITDPPYGCGKADWDTHFPVEWYQIVRGMGALVAVITGSSGLKDSVSLVGDDFVDVIAARNLNGMTRGPIGYGNWLAAVVACQKPPMGINCFEFSVMGDQPDHPSPKPIQYMTRIVQRVSDTAALVLDPFMGSGTTGIACIRTGRRFIGIEIDPTHYATACRRIDNELQQMPLLEAQA